MARGAIPALSTAEGNLFVFSRLLDTASPQRLRLPTLLSRECLARERRALEAVTAQRYGVQKVASPKSMATPPTTPPVSCPESSGHSLKEG